MDTFKPVENNVMRGSLKKNPIKNLTFARAIILDGGLSQKHETNIAVQDTKNQLVCFPKHHKIRKNFIEHAKIKANLFIDKPRLAYGLANAYFHKKTINPSGCRRLRKRSVRVRLSKVAQILFHYSSVEHMCFGYKVEATGQMHFFTRKKLMDLSSSTYNRVTEALKILESEGYIRIKERKRKISNTEFRSDDAIIFLNPEFYYAFGVSEEKLSRHRFDGYRAEINKLTPKDYALAKRESKAIRKRLREVDELPGSERKRETQPLYRDYTGKTELARSTFNQPTPTAKSHLAQMIAMLAQKQKPPS